MPYSLTLIFSHPDLTIDVSIPGFDSKKDAETFNDIRAGELILLPHLEVPEKTMVLLKEEQDGFRVIEDEQMVFTIDTKKEQRPRPLDPSDPDDFKVIIESLQNPDSLYNVHPEDMEKIPDPIEDAWKGEIPFSFGDAIAYAIEEEKSSTINHGDKSCK